MNAKDVIARLDEMLKPLGFEKHKTTWNLKSSLFVDVVDLQTSKTGDMITINAGVLHLGVHGKYWGGDFPKFIEEPFCTVRVRIGQLLDGNDLWWQLNADDVANEITEKVCLQVLPFLEQMHSAEAMERFLTNAQVVKKKYPPPVIYLAILKHEMGDADSASKLLGDLKKTTVGAWQERISQITKNLFCF